MLYRLHIFFTQSDRPLKNIAVGPNQFWLGQSCQSCLASCIAVPKYFLHSFALLRSIKPTRGHSACCGHWLGHCCGMTGKITTPILENVLMLLLFIYNLYESYTACGICLRWWSVWKTVKLVFWIFFGAEKRCLISYWRIDSLKLAMWKWMVGRLTRCWLHRIQLTWQLTFGGVECSKIIFLWPGGWGQWIEGLWQGDQVQVCPFSTHVAALLKLIQHRPVGLWRRQWKSTNWRMPHQPVPTVDISCPKPQSTWLGDAKTSGWGIRSREGKSKHRGLLSIGYWTVTFAVTFAPPGVF